MRKIMICSGAGLSAESGIATFRDAGGLWENHRIDEVCDITTFLENYSKVNQFYDNRRAQLSDVAPNSAHYAIADMEKEFEVINFTTNVDDLLERAGCSNVRHIHGNLLEVATNYGTKNEKIVKVGYEKSPYEDQSLYPVKPNVVFFGEHAPMYQVLHDEMGDLPHDAVMLIVGSSEEVVQFTLLARHIAKFRGKIVFVNPDEDLHIDVAREQVMGYRMSATQFFEQVNWDAIYNSPNPTLRKVDSPFF